MARQSAKRPSTAPADTLAAGWHAVVAALRSPATRIDTVWIRAGRSDARAAQVLDLLHARGMEATAVDAQALDEMASGLNHQGVLARLAPAQAFSEDALYALLRGLDHAPLLLVLDGVQDPHNLGACLRSADAAGADAVVIPRDRAASVTPAARKVAAGAAETVPVCQVTNLARCLRCLQELGLWLTGLDADADASLYDMDLSGPAALVLGAEARGLRRLTRESCDFLGALPMQGMVESLNVSVAAGIVLFEARRQRMQRLLAK